MSIRRRKRMTMVGLQNRVELLSKDQVAEQLLVKPDTVMYLHKTWQLRGFVLARKLRFRQIAVEEYVRNCEKKGSE
jgi:hypothetical protein